MRNDTTIQLETRGMMNTSMYSPVNKLFFWGGGGPGPWRCSLGPGTPGSGGTRVTAGVVRWEYDWQSAFLVVVKPREEELNHWGEVVRHLGPLLRVSVYVKQHDGLQWASPSAVGATGPGEPHSTSWDGEGWRGGGKQCVNMYEWRGMYEYAETWGRIV